MTHETAEKHAIKDFLKAKGWFVYHNLAGIGVFAGLPDLTSIKHGQVLQIEVKAEKGKQSDHQKRFQADWQQKGGLYFCGGVDELIAFFKKHKL